MKVFLFELIFLILFQFTSSKLRKIFPITNSTENLIETDDDICKIECQKLSQATSCFCDFQCQIFGDCCQIFLKGCENFHNITKRNDSSLIGVINITPPIGSCCNTSEKPFDCFCDSKCQEKGDCCKDYLKCPKRIHVKKRAPIEPSEIWKSVLTPQLSTVYIDRKNNRTITYEVNYSAFK